MSEWKETTLGKLAEVQTGPFGSQLKNEQYITGGTPVVTVEHIKDFLIEDFVYPSVTCEDKNRLSRYILKSGDIVFSRVGSVDLSALVKEHQDGWLFSSRMLRVRVKEKLDTNFLSYYLRQPSIRQFIINISVGSTMPSINTEILKSLPIIYCSLQEQKSIADVLSCLDARIENLRRQNETLEAIAQTLFKHWFIDFEFPNADGKPYKSSGGAMIPSELGEIPEGEGWRVGTLGEFTDISIGRTPPRKETEWFSINSQDIKWISIRDMGDCGVYIVNTSEYLTQEAVNKFNIPIIPEDTVILSFKLTVGRVAITTEEMLSNEAIAHIKIIDNCLNTEYIYLFLKQYNFSSLGSTSSIATAVNSKSIKSISILLSNKHCVVDFQKNVNSIFRKIKLNTKQIQTLTKTRDALLPKLMSGQIRVEI
ncbi:hypothetical protein A6769_33305 [Nostoc punctiforme NIES-2108]|uniref:Type I restriction modification DNA specificity domain-containing protein n=1 Tax=Nostoc punctiforme NIES-2108 TaxID=1356359 RepID=A0A367R230_NOSPU|nr:hypothetical protein A6769_33305 [Nostoc punctiforme NIES-2108]